MEGEGGVVRCRFGTPANYAIVEAQILCKKIIVLLTLILAYERIACRAPSEFTVTAPTAFPEDVPFSIALTNDEYDPWTETSHKFRFYE